MICHSNPSPSPSPHPSPLVTAAIEELTRAVEAKEQNRVLQALKAPVLELQGVDDQAAPQ